jgi:hypothetical protein
MSTDVDDVLTDEQIEAAQAAEDEAIGNLEVKDEDEKEASESEAPAAVADEAVQTAEPEAQPDTAKVAGVASKDGTRVLPYAALQAERRAARHERSARERAEAESAALRQQIADLKAGKTPTEAETTDELSDDELAEVARDFPQVAKVAKQVRVLQERLTKLAPEDSRTEAPAEPADDPVQEAIDSVPQLLEWQASDPEKFARARVLDDVAKTSPKWRDKPLAERFAHVARQVADEFDIPSADTPRNTSKPNTVDPKKAISQVARSAPNTLSDLKGGAVDQTEQRIERMPPAKAQARMSQMTDAEIEAHLAKFG